MFSSGYIRGWRADTFWFLALPFLAIGVALACQQWLTAVALASVGLCISVPHHFATWARTYGLKEDWDRWKDRLIVGPILIAIAVAAGLTWAPYSLLLVAVLWDTQHSLMQQHGFARIYDFKARAGAPSTGRFDLILAWVLFGNLFITSPMFAKMWLQELYRFEIPLSAGAVKVLQQASWTVTGCFLLVYLGHVVWSVAQGYKINPIKYLFIGASYFLWYFTSWQANSILVFGIAHRTMHGLQYIVIVYWYIERKRTLLGPNRTGRERWVLPSGIAMFVLMAAFYAVAYALITREPLDHFGFGVVHFQAVYQGAPKYGVEPMSSQAGYQLFAAVVIECAALIHFYFDSFIWKVRDTKTQSGLAAQG